MITKTLTDSGTALIGDIVDISALLLRSAATDSALDGLGAALQKVCPFSDFIAFLYRRHSRPLILTTNLGMEWLTDRLSEYSEGLYLLDPFYQKAIARESGFHRLSDISPEEYFDSEYYNHFYKHTNIVDETRFIVPLDDDDAGSMQILAARAGDLPGFQDFELALLGAFHPLVAEYCRMHFDRSGQAYRDSPQRADMFDLRDKIAALPGAQLTAREIDTVELMLKGHSTKSVARVLNIDDGTVSNHKRNIYQKLDIHSQAQLFNLFLESLTGA